MPPYQPRVEQDVVYFAGQPINHTSYLRKNTGTMIEHIDGWLGNVDVRDAREPKTGRDGEHPDNAYLGGRAITISGTVTGSSYADLQDRIRDLSAVFAHDDTEQLLKVPDPTSTVESSLYEYALDLAPLVAYWRLGESSGASARDSKGTNHGTYAGTYTLGTAGTIAGDEDTCVDLDGSTGHVTIPYAAGTLGTAQWTFSAWVSADDANANIGVLIDNRNGSTNGWMIRIDGFRDIQVENHAALQVVTNGNYISASTWHHVAVTYDGTTVRIYIDGVERASGALAITARSTGTAYLGRTAAGTNHLDGRLDEVMIFNDDLTADQVLQLYRRGSGQVANNDTSGYERVLARVVEPLVPGQQIGPGMCAWTVALRASDPRIYSDVETSVTSTVVSGTKRSAAITNNGRVSTPCRIASPLSPGSFFGEATKVACSAGGQVAYLADVIQANDVVTVDTGARTADWQTPYHNGRLKLFDPVALWRLNETSGTVADNAEGTAALDGTYANTPTLNQAGHDTGIGAVQFDGAQSEYVSVPFNAALVPSTLSIELWLYYTSTGSPQGIMEHFQVGEGWYVTLINGDRVKVSWVDGSGSGELYYNDVFTTGTWYHLAIVFGANGVVLYRDGAKDTGMSYLAAGAAYNPVAAGALHIGRITAGSTSYLTGRMDNVALYDRELTASEVAALYAARAATPTFEDLGYRVIEPSATDWFLLPKGSSTITGYYGHSADFTVTYREARV